MPSVTCACQGCGCEQVRCRIERCDQSSSECSSAEVYWQPRHTSLGHLSAWIPVWSNVEQKAFKSVVSSGDFIVKHPHILGFHKDPGFGHAHTIVQCLMDQAFCTLDISTMSLAFLCPTIFKITTCDQSCPTSTGSSIGQIRPASTLT